MRERTRERRVHKPKHFTYTLTFQFYLLPTMLSGAASPEATKRQPERLKNPGERQKVSFST